MVIRRTALAVLAVFPLFAGSATAADLGRKAPELVINMPSGNPVRLSQYKGKVVAVCFILTTCPHCQKTIGHLIQDQNQYGARGFQVLASAIEQGSAFSVPGFINTFKPTFPVGYNDPSVAVEFLQHPPMLIPHMPMLAFVDRQGNIRDQHEGDDSKFFNEQQDQNLRKQIEALLNESATGAKKGPAKKSASPKKQS